jgi:hypothetical protein
VWISHRSGPDGRFTENAIHPRVIRNQRTYPECGDGAPPSKGNDAAGAAGSIRVLGSADGAFGEVAGAAFDDARGDFFDHLLEEEAQV